MIRYTRCFPNIKVVKFTSFRHFPKRTNEQTKGKEISLGKYSKDKIKQKRPNGYTYQPFCKGCRKTEWNDEANMPLFWFGKRPPRVLVFPFFFFFFFFCLSVHRVFWCLFCGSFSVLIVAFLI
jgi:hypothetical protein